MKMREVVDVKKYFESKEFQDLYNYDGKLGKNNWNRFRRT